MSPEDDPEHQEHRRVARLFARDPDLLARAASQEQALIARLRARLGEHLEGPTPGASCWSVK